MLEGDFTLLLRGLGTGEKIGAEVTRSCGSSSLKVWKQYYCHCFRIVTIIPEIHKLTLIPNLDV
jgi:hypothetical protein